MKHEMYKESQIQGDNRYAFECIRLGDRHLNNNARSTYREVQVCDAVQILKC